MPDIEQLVRHADPARQVHIPRASSVEGRRLYEQVTAGPTLGGARLAPRTLVLSGLGLTAATAAVVAAVAVASSGPRPFTATLVLDRVAKVAASRPATAPPPPGDYLYTGSVGFELASQVGSAGNAEASQTYSVVAPFRRQVWVTNDGSGRLEQNYFDPSFPSAADRAAWAADGSPESDGMPSILQDVDSAQKPGQLSPDLTSLPTDPTTLLSEIEAGDVDSGGLPPGDAGAFQIVEELLQETDASSALRAALYEVASEIPGVSLVGAVHDAVGRPGVGVAYTGGGVRDVLIFDPSTSELLGEQTVVADATDFCRLGLAEGTVIFSTSYVTSGTVGSTSAVPPGQTLSSFQVPLPSQPTAASPANKCPLGAEQATTGPPVLSTTVP